MSFIVSKEVKASEIMDTIKKAGGRLLDKIDVFDVYQGDTMDSNQKSIAFTLDFRSADRTLTEEEVMEIFNHIIEQVEKTNHAILRDK